MSSAYVSLRPEPEDTVLMLADQTAGGTATVFGVGSSIIGFGSFVDALIWLDHCKRLIESELQRRDALRGLR